jgi:hypothetical protein
VEHIAIPILVRPTGTPNPINLGAKGVIPVAGLSTEDLDATTLDVATVTLGDGTGPGTGVAARPNGTLMASVEDVDGDGLDDLVLHFRMPELVANGDVSAATTELHLEAFLDDGCSNVLGTDQVTVVPWDPLTLRQAVFGQERLDEIAALDTPLSRFFTRICAATLEFDRRVGIDGTTHPDSLTAAVLLHPELVRRASPYHVDVETAGELTRGYSAMSWGVHGLEPNARVVEEIDPEAFYALVKGLLALETAPEREITGL